METSITAKMALRNPKEALMFYKSMTYCPECEPFRAKGFVLSE